MHRSSAGERVITSKAGRSAQLQALQQVHYHQRTEADHAPLQRMRIHHQGSEVQRRPR